MTNENGKIKYFNRTYNIFESVGMKLTRFETAVLGLVDSFSRLSDESRLYASVREMAELFHRSVRQTSRVLKKLDEKKLVDRKHRFHTSDTYRSLLPAVNEAYIKTAFWLYAQKVETASGQERYLTSIEIDVFCLMAAHCLNKNTKKFKGTMRSIARMLKCSPASVSNAIDTLFKLDWIARPKEEKSLHRGAVSTYHVKSSLLRKLAAEYKVKLKMPTKTPEEEVAERNAFYAREQARAEREIKEVEAKLLEDPIYRLAFQQYKKDFSPRKEALAEIKADQMSNKSYYHNFLKEKERRQKELKAIKIQTLQDLDIPIQSLSPRRRCVKCSDTGWLPGGRSCDCYRGEWV